MATENETKTDDEKDDDADLKILRTCKRALSRSSSPKMLAANLKYLNDYFADDVAYQAKE